MTDKQSRPEDIVAGERLRAILARAAELDASGLTGVNRYELQRIAEEAGISAAAFNQALQEDSTPPAAKPDPAHASQHATLRLTPTPKAPWGLGNALKSVLSFGLIGAAFGFWAPTDDRGEALVLSVAVILAAGLYRAFQHRKDRNSAAFQTELLSLFGGMLWTYFASAPRVDPDVITGVPVIAAIAVMIGSAIVKFETGREQNATASPIPGQQRA
jgi:hypothetical protein